MEVIDNSTRMNSAFFAKFSSAILAIEKELGIKPSNTYSDVRQRLDAMAVGINTLTSYGASHSTTIATHYPINWISPAIVLPDFSVHVLPKVIGQIPVNLRNEAGWPDGYGVLYFMNRFYVDNQIDNFELSLWEVSGTPTEIVSNTFITPGEHTYTILLGLSLDDLDKIYEVRVKQTSGSILPPTEINSVMWNSRFMFMATGDFSGIVPPPEFKYITNTFDFLDVFIGSKLIGNIDTQAMVQSVSLIIDTAFDGATEISVGDAAVNDRLMEVTQNIPAVINTYRNNSDYEYTVSTPISVYFPAGAPTVGSGTIIIYYH